MAELFRPLTGRRRTHIIAVAQAQKAVIADRGRILFSFKKKLTGLGEYLRRITLAADFEVAEQQSPVFGGALFKGGHSIVAAFFDGCSETTPEEAKEKPSCQEKLFSMAGRCTASRKEHIKSAGRKLQPAQKRIVRDMVEGIDIDGYPMMDIPVGQTINDESGMV